MPTIILSFDDSRDDFYTRVFPIVKKYNIPVTLNVISSFVMGNVSCDFPSSCNKAMMCEQVVECQRSGLVEIACHGATHQNSKDDIIRNISELKLMGCDVSNVGFASQGSEISRANRNNDGIWDLVEDGTISYLRSGIIVRREGMFFSALSLLDAAIHSKWLYFELNKKVIIHNPSEPFFLSAAIVSYTTTNQVKYLIEKFAKLYRNDKNSALILMFHSILRKDDLGYGKDKWFWTEEQFEELCSYLVENNQIRVLTTIEYVKRILNKG